LRAGGQGEEGWRPDSAGIVAAARQVPSPNFDERPGGSLVELIVVHNISLPPGVFGGTGIIELFTNRLDPAEHPYYREIEGLRVSSHFLIRRDGEPIQFVACGKRAWHAGQSQWCGRSRCNDFSIGIELEGADDAPFEDAQYLQLANLVRSLGQAYPIADCVGHSDIATPAGRKTDPGPYFDWPRFRSLLKNSA
jgi:N-acetyl-anhydromuramoyl-L-alanine amidase